MESASTQNMAANIKQYQVSEWQNLTPSQHILNDVEDKSFHNSGYKT